jgi:hypothetical protein
MATKKNKSTTSKNTSKELDLATLKTKYALTRIHIKAGREKNTNAHKDLKRQIARKLTQDSINKLSQK